MADSNDGRKEEGSDNFERRRRGVSQQNNPQRPVAPVHDNTDIQFASAINPLAHFNEPLLLSANSQLAAQQILLQHLGAMSQQQFVPPQTHTTSSRYGFGTDTLPEHGIANTAMFHPSQITNTAGSIMGTTLLPPEQSVPYQAPSVALGQHTETSTGASILPEHSISHPKPVKPKRPLSAYNIFFQEERAKIIEEREDGGGKESPVTSPTQTKQRYQRTGTGFEDLAKEISKRWKNIDSDRLAGCSRLADADKERYQTELAAYNNLREENLSAKQRAQEASVSEETWRQYHVAAEKQKPARKRQKKDHGKGAKRGP